MDCKTTNKMDKKSDLMYVVTAYRWGNKADHSYVVGVFDDLEKAKDCADSQMMYRGGKYECIVEEMSLNLYDEDGEDSTEVYKASTNKTSLYAGAVCPKCKKGINNEEPIAGYDEIRKRQQKRYGMARLCNQCIKGYIKDENH